MRRFSLLLAGMLLTIAAFAQKNGSVKGLAFDTLGKQPVGSVTVSVLDRKDSSLISFTMTDNQGRFELKGIPNGNYRLLMTHIGYHGSNSFFTISDSSKHHDLGNIVLSDLSKVLEEVVISNEAPPVTMVGDTVQYNAGSFKVQPNASVEELLKKLPGVKVEKDGSITAQGEKATRVLVDGKEFFGNDPKVATRNLPADAVDKVQVYDKRSDQAQLTGFDDGNYEKTINLKLKKDKKKGVFGKVTAGAGDQGRYEGRFNVNSFKGARQMSAIGMANNTNAEGFSFMDILSFSGALNQMRQDGGGSMSLSLSQEDAASYGMGNNNNNGINTSWAGGINFNDIIGKSLDLQSNYFYNRYNPNIKSEVVRQNFLPNGSTFYRQKGYSDNLNNTNRFNINTLWQIDSSSTLRINPSFNHQVTRNKSMSDYDTRAENGDTINAGFSNRMAESSGFNFRNDMIYRKKFKRGGRTLSLSFNTIINKSDGTGDLESIIRYYQGGAIARRDTLDQQSSTSNSLKGYTARIVYTEPLWKRTLLELSVGQSNMWNNAEKITNDFNRLSNKYDKVNRQLTNDFENTNGITTAGIRMRKQGRKYNYSLGFTWQQVALEGRIIAGSKDSLIKKGFTNILPTASFKYNFTRYKYVNLNYIASTTQPTIAQLQPVPDNSNPLYIREGNPDLKQEINHIMRMNINMLSPFSNRNLFFFLSGTATSNKIVNNDTIDIATGIRSTRPVNVNGVYNFTGNFSYSAPVRFLKGTVRVATTAYYVKTKQFLNKFENTIYSMGLGPSLDLDINATEWLTLTAGADWKVNKTKYSLQSAQDNKYLSQEYSTSATLTLPKQFFFSTDFAYTINSQRAAGFNGNIPIWNASISKQFLKYNRGQLKFAASDLLNRNTGVTRTANQNFIEDRRANTLRRFFLLSFTYSLSKTGANSGGPGGMRMISR